MGRPTDVGRALEEDIPMPEQFAMELWRRYHLGASIEQLADETHIPVDRITARIKAARAVIQRRQEISNERFKTFIVSTGLRLHMRV